MITYVKTICRAIKRILKKINLKKTYKILFFITVLCIQECFLEKITTQELKTAYVAGCRSKTVCILPLLGFFRFPLKVHTK